MRPGGYGYGYGASHDADEETSDSDTSSRESESSQSQASHEVEVGQSIPDRSAQKGGSVPGALPTRRSITFKEEVLILTDSAREFTKLSFRQSAPRKRFKEPPPAAKRIRIDTAGRVLRSPPPERTKGEPQISSREAIRAPEPTQVSKQDGRKKRNRKKKSPDGPATDRMPGKTAKAAAQEQKTLGADCADLQQETMQEKQHDPTDSLEEPVKPQTRSCTSRLSLQENQSQQDESGRQESAKKEAVNLADLTNHAEPGVLTTLSTPSAATEAKQDDTDLQAQQQPEQAPAATRSPDKAVDEPVVPSKKEHWDHGRWLTAAASPEVDGVRQVTGPGHSAGEIQAGRASLEPQRHWRPPPKLALPKEIRPWKLCDYRGTELRARATSRQHPQLTVEELPSRAEGKPCPKAGNARQAPRRGARGVRLAEEWRPPPPLLLPQEIQPWNHSDYRGTELRVRAKARQHPQLQVEDTANDYTAKLAGLLSALETEFAEPAALLKQFWTRLAIGERARFVQEFPQFLRHLPDARRIPGYLP